ncbi:energy transducer TonB [Rhodoferax sp.]|uniref:energy transducer TonB n=1 Tax=Rhodoferax sp. TaxID=50421 RepID=UPI0027250D8E|nr:TonB C-terminal domain-containing protein [Rhodoferax sp.]MDO9145432.1 TonB C-terminal domain-containing protein [Rhodoferax sp.]MDP3865916.1 TonB C-terminal domain-containing protein [Rhodoferax sp.]
MHAAADRLEFAPPATPGVVRAVLLALLAHGLLVAALTWGVHWQREAQIISIEAELWATVPVAAAPRLQEPLAEPIQPERPEPVTQAPPPPKPVVAPPKVDIALEQEKQRLQKQKQLALEQQQEKLKQDKQQQKALEEKRKAEQLKQVQADKAKLAQEKKLAEQEVRRLEAQRAENLKRMSGLAGASGSASSAGTALKSAGPSASYAGRVIARVKPNIVFTEAISGNPTAIIEVRTSSDGTIIARKLTQSSGVRDWDEAVLRAIDKTEVLPRDTDGRVPSPLLISFRPKD